MLVLYFMPYFISLGSIGDSLIIPDWGAGLATITFVYSFLLYLWPPTKALFFGSYTTYVLLAATTGALVVATGGTFSTFVSLWIVVAVFAAVFGIAGIIAMIGGSVAYCIYLTTLSTPIPYGAVGVTIVSTLVPVVASYIIFHRQRKTKGGSIEQSAYNELASELTQAHGQSDIVIQAIDDGVIAVDSKGNIQLINPAAQRILGWGNSDALNLNYGSVLKLSDEKNQTPDDAVHPVANVLATNQDVHSKDFYATTGGGKRIRLSLVVSPIGQIGKGAIIVFRDITKEYAEEREKAEFISTASHEMRTPVASIEGYLGLALNPSTAQIDDKAREYIEKAQASAKHLGRLFQDLLDVSKAEDGRLSNHPKIVDVVEYIGDVVEGLHPRATEKNLRLFYKPKPDEDKSAGDRTIAPVYYANVDNDHLREVVANLVENAIKYTPKGDVIVDVSGNDDTVTISVQDSGIGIAKEDLPHLFQKFYRIDNSATREIGGTGLGLYLCRRLSEVMGGRIWVESEFKKGSMFNLEIPRLDRAEAMRLLEAEENKIIAQATDTGTGESSLEGNSMLTDSLVEPRTYSAPPSEKATEAQAEIIDTPQMPETPKPQPVQTPTPEPFPQPITPVAPASAPQSPQPTTTAPTLAAIEKNPENYTSRATQPVQIPVRDTSEAANIPTSSNNPPKS